MITKEDLAVIKALRQRGVYLEDIAAELGVHPKTVSRALKRGAALQQRRRERGSKLDAYTPLSEGVWNAVVVQTPVNSCATATTSFAKLRTGLRLDRRRAIHLHCAPLALPARASEAPVGPGSVGGVTR